ncbi:MAG: LysE family translocator, partial [Pseudomonadota bacterium]|nr:LysE family translocator [Pseudomonadota bacterium]
FSAGAGVAALMLKLPALFALFKWLGGAYLVYLGVRMWRSRGRMAIPDEIDAAAPPARRELAMQGFVTAVANPKGWAFFVALLPPFLEPSRPLMGQLAGLVVIILSLEFSCLLLYASGGKSHRHLLARGGSVRLLNRIAGTLMIGVGFWLALG